MLEIIIKKDKNLAQKRYFLNNIAGFLMIVVKESPNLFGVGLFLFPEPF